MADPFQLSLFLTAFRTELTWLPQLSSGRITAETPVFNSTSIAACVSVAAGTCLPRRFLAAAVYSVVCLAAVAYKRMLFQSRPLATAVSMAPQFLLRANMPQYV
jgi:hypothetical protein